MVKFTSVLLSLFLLSSSALTVKAAPLVPKEALKSPVSTLRDTTLTSISKSKGDILYEDDDVVRLLIEVTGKPVIDAATERGVSVKDLAKTLRKSITDKNRASQKSVKDLIKAAGISLKELETYDNVLNGFSIETTYKNLKTIKNLKGVTHVSVAHTFSRPEPDMNSSTEMVNAIKTWTDTGYNGEGMVVAIIDTGIDPSHKDMILTDESKVKLTASTLNGLPGTYRTAKVPYGYNYMDKNQEILDLRPGASMYGMHVAGTVGANGDLLTGGIKGVAPEAQLLAMKVFGNNPSMPSTFGDVIVKAIDDSVALGADVINMSLGSIASYVDENDLEQVAIRNAMENGVIAAVSAGNSAMFGDGFDNPYTENPDIGVVGSPGLAPETIQVASIENNIITANALSYFYAGEELLAPYISAGPKDPKDVFAERVPYLHAGLGGPDDFAEQDFSGKIALIERGSYDFTAKILNASNNGAIGVIIYNSPAGGDGLISMRYPEGISIPAVFIGRSHGLNLVELLQTEGNYVAFSGKLAKAGNPAAGNLSLFSSWGATPNLDFKPEITAPGGNIWSTAQNNQYQSMSGTSMAAPHVAGGSALVLQRVDEYFNLSSSERVLMAKNLLMNTAITHHDTGVYNSSYGTGDYNYTSPRRQGAGVMDVYAAVVSPAVAYEKTSGIGKVSLQEMEDVTTFTIEVKNLSDEEVTYVPRGTVQTDLSDGEYNYLETQGVYLDGTLEEYGPNGLYSGEYPIYFSEDSLTIQAGETRTLTVTVDVTHGVDWYYGLPLAEVFPNGTFLEGFVVLEDPEEMNPTLSIPYMGFYGQWDKAPVVDQSIYEGRSFYGITTLAWYDQPNEMFEFLGVDLTGARDKNTIAFSPNRDKNRDDVMPLLSFLRNAKEMELNILDESGKIIRALYKDSNLTKNYYDGGNGTMYTASLDWIWDGTAGGKLVKDGNYFYEVKTKIDFTDADWQSVKFPIKVDTKKPMKESLTYDEDAKTLTVEGKDEHSGIYAYVLEITGEEPVANDTGIFDFTDVTLTKKSTLKIYDFAGNVETLDLSKELRKIMKPVNPSLPGIPVPEPPMPPAPSYEEPKIPVSGDVDAPVVMIESPEFFETVTSKMVTVTGTVSDSSSLEYLKINGMNVLYRWNAASGKWVFSHTLLLEDGYRSLRVDVKDKAGNQLDFLHKIFVDTKKPVITLSESLPRVTKEASITLKALVTDNLPDLKVTLNGNMLVNIKEDWSYFDSLSPASYTLEETIPLNLGNNTILLEAEDSAGNLTKLTYTIKRNK